MAVSSSTISPNRSLAMQIAASVTEPEYVLPASFAQQRLWFLQQLEPGQTSFLVPRAWRLSGPLDAAAVNFAVNRIVERHDTLRTAFVVQDEVPVQAVHPYRAFEIDVEDISDTPDPTSAAAEIALAEANTSFDLAAGMLFRCRILRLSPNEHVLLYMTHHIINDGWSNGVWMREFTAFYREKALGEPASLAELQIQYGDYAAWQQDYLTGKTLDHQLAFWKKALEGAPTLLDLPSDRPRQRVVSPEGDRIRFAISQTLTEELRKLARETNSTLFMVMLAAFEVLVSRYAGQEDFLLGTPIANRERLELEPLIGLFNNVLLIRASVMAGASFREVLATVKSFTLDAYAHQEMPFEKLVEHLQPQRSLSYNPLFQVMFALQNTPREPARLPGLDISSVPGGRLKTNQDIFMSIDDASAKLQGVIEYSKALFDQATIDRMASHYLRLLEAVVADSSRPVSTLAILHEAELQQLTHGWNDTAFDYPRQKSLHQLISEQAAARPAATAVLFAHESLTFAELDHRSNRLAHHLQSRGVFRGQRVGIYLNRSLDLVVSLLAVMKTGAAYVPLDPNYPAKRVEGILEDADASCLITKSDLKSKLKDFAQPVVLLDKESTEIDSQGLSPVDSGATPDDLVYVIFTSGSTGRPKGVEITHRAVVNLLTWMSKELGMGPGDVFPALASFGFDMSVPELYLPLATGGTLALAEAHLAGNGEELQKFLLLHHATIVHATPTTWNLLLDCGFTGEGLKRCIGAEPLPRGLFERLMEAAPGTPLWNFYGPTETTVWSTFHRFTGADETILVGKPLANTQVYILDKAGQLCPIGVPGEIVIAGDGVARGYRSAPELTAEKFIDDPFSSGSGSRMYRTADLGRWTAAGAIEHLGRVDNQVKIRGFRIELGEIEAALTALPAVREAVVVVREDIPGDKRLIAYVVSSEAPDQATLRAGLKELLPEYMIPAAFVAFERLPLTPNGKVDRKNLPAPEVYAGGGAGQAPRTPTEIQIAEIWKQILRVATVNLEDDFFHLGGHSLLATQMISRIFERVGVKVPLAEIFECSTLESFANAVEKANSASDRALQGPIPSAVRPARLPLSFGQQRFWFLDQLEPGSSFFNVPMKWRLRGTLDLAALQAALDQIVSRHEALRTHFVMAGSDPVQLIAPPAPVPIAVYDLSAFAESESEARSRILVTEEANRPFDLQNGPIFRVALVKLSAAEHVLVLNTHHIAIDGWSMGLLREEFAILYTAFASGEPAPLAPLPLQYADFALWQRTIFAGEALEEQLAYWKQHLRDAPTSIELPTDKPRPAVQTHRGASRATALPLELIERLKSLSRHEGATLYMILLSAFCVLLSRYSGQKDIVVGSAIAGRTQRETERLIGLFLNSLALRTDLTGNPTFLELLHRVRATAVAAYSHQDVPFERLVEELKPVRDTSRSPLYQVMMILQNLPPQQTQIAGLELSGFGTERESSQMDLLLNLFEHPAGITATLIYNTDLFEKATVERMLAHFQCLLKGIVENPGACIENLSLLWPDERHKILYEWNATSTDYPRGLCTHQLFEQQAARVPDRVAVRAGSKRLTYSELNARANQVAHHLRKQGAGPGTLVGIQMARSVNLVAALLGVLKAGAGYVPLDPNFPADRIAFILQDADATLVITDDDWLRFDSESAENPSFEVTPDDLAYVLHTSGSTGRPKGVQITHRNLVNFLTSMQEQPGLRESDVLLAVTTISFDIAGLEIYLPLVTGATVLLASHQDATDPNRLQEMLRQGTTVLQATPATWRMLLDAGWSGNPNLKALCGGEAFQAELVAQLLPRCAELWNMYGPTETTIWSSICRLTSPPSGTASLGRPIGNTTMYILDPRLQPVPIGVPGALYIGGDGVARGYLNRPELTAANFIADPFVEGARIYRTGDLARFDIHGEVHYLGRTDHQVKIRGFRIELGEIETALAAITGIREAVAIVREDTPGDKRLVAYLVADSTLDRAALRARLKDTLPDYMVPSAFVPLERMPLTPNGKVDRLHLPAPAGDDPADHAGREPRTYMEVLLAGIWKDILKINRVTTADDFFELGGHSLLAAAMTNKLSESLGYRVRLVTLFEAHTLGALAEAAESQSFDQEQLTAIVPIHSAGTKPALFCISRPNVNSLGFIFLSRALSENQPVYGMQSNMENDGVLTPFTQLEYEEKAAEYVAAMREIQPEGPYFLTGFCEGAHIAFEMARQLEAMNLEVGKVFILDAWPVENTVDRRRFVMHRYFNVLRRYWKAIKRRLVSLEVRRREDMLLSTKKQFIDSSLLTDPDARKLLIQKIEGRYWPGKDFAPTIYNGDLVVFRVAKQLFYRVKDESLGWAKRVRGSIEVVHVPGTHGLILREPGVSVVARELEARIDEYLARNAAEMEIAAHQQ